MRLVNKTDLENLLGDNTFNYSMMECDGKFNLKRFKIITFRYKRTLAIKCKILI